MMIQRYTKELKRSYENVTRWNISKFITRIYLTEAWKCISLFLTHQLPWDRSHSFQIQLLKLRYREKEKERAIHYLDATEQSSIQFTHNALFSNGFCVCVSIRWCTWMKNKKKSILKRKRMLCMIRDCFILDLIAVLCSTTQI